MSAKPEPFTGETATDSSDIWSWAYSFGICTQCFFWMFLALLMIVAYAAGLELTDFRYVGF